MGSTLGNWREWWRSRLQVWGQSHLQKGHIQCYDTATAIALPCKLSNIAYFTFFVCSMCWLHIIAWDHWKRMDSVTWQFWGASVQFLQTEKIGNQKMGSESKLRKVNIYILEVIHPPTVYIHNSWFNQQFVQSFIFGATSVLFLNCHFWAKTSLLILKDLQNEERQNLL